jgi:hypothetical protein
LADIRRLAVTRLAAFTARLDIVSNVPWPTSVGWW